MKRIGIITTFRQANWGSVLQAYALYEAVKRLGYDSEVIDYIYPNDYHAQFGVKWSSYTPSLKWRIGILLGVSAKPRMPAFNRFISEYMKVSVVCPDRESLRRLPPYDIYLTGSDQVWNPATMYGDMSYMCDFAADDAKRVSYAASFACDSLPAEMKDLYRENLCRYSHISVRERNGVPIVNALTDTPARVVLDPTLLLDRKDWCSIAERAHDVKAPTRYILLYMLGYTYAPEDAMAKILTDVQTRTGLPVVALHGVPSSFKGKVCRLSNRHAIGIEEFLNLIRNASIVVTSSFHGTAFSLNMGVPFVALMDGKSTADDRILTILSSMGMTERLLTTDNLEIDDSLLQPYDVDAEQQRLAELRADSLAWLAEALKG